MRPLPPHQAARFAGRLARLLGLGFSPAEAVERIRAGSPRALGSFLQELGGQLRAGATVGQGVERCGALPPVLVQALQTEDAPAALRRASQLLQESEQRRRRLRAALAYPRLVALVLGGVLILLDQAGLWRLTLAVGAGSPLAALQRLLDHPAFLGVTGLAVAGFQWLLTAPSAQGLLCRLPLLGDWVRAQETVTWLSWLDFFLSRGQPLDRSAALAATGLSPGWFRRSLEEAAARVSQGTALGEALARGRALPDLERWLVGRAERAGFPPAHLARIAAFADRQLETSFEQGLELLEPALLLVLGGAAAALVCLAFGPMFVATEFLG